MEVLNNLLSSVLDNPAPIHAQPAPWKATSPQRFVQYHLKGDSLDFAAIEAFSRPAKLLRLKTAFPVLPETRPWILETHSASDAYGSFEGLILGQAPSGHPLQWFAPDFLFHAREWKTPGIIKVGIAGLALNLEPFEARPFVITDGPGIEEERQRLRALGKHQAAEELTSLTISTNSIRTLYSQTHDHASLIGKILRLEKITLNEWNGTPGFRMEIEVLPYRLPTGYVLSVYAFGSALGGYAPKRGDLVQGLVWLQGSHLGIATEKDQTLYSKTKSHHHPAPSSPAHKKQRKN